jgi:hypothetical protein
LFGHLISGIPAETGLSLAVPYFYCAAFGSRSGCDVMSKLPLAQMQLFYLTVEPSSASLLILWIHLCQEQSQTPLRS